MEPQQTCRGGPWNWIAEFPPELNRRITIRKISADLSLAEFFSGEFSAAVKNTADTAIGDGWGVWSDVQVAVSLHSSECQSSLLLLWILLLLLLLLLMMILLLLNIVVAVINGIQKLWHISNDVDATRRITHSNIWPCSHLNLDPRPSKCNQFI